MDTRDLLIFKEFLEERHKVGWLWSNQEAHECHQKLETEIAFRQLAQLIPHPRFEDLADRFDFHDYSTKEHRKSDWKAAIAEANKHADCEQRRNALLCIR